MEHINNYINENKDRFINELIELLKIPSISADPAYKKDVLDCADAVAKAMKDAICNINSIEYNVSFEYFKTEA